MTSITRIFSIRDIAATVRARRLELGLSQAEVASRARVSRQWLSRFEAGRPSAELGLVMRLLAALDLDMSLQARNASEAPAARGPVDLDALLDEYRRT